MNYSYVRQQMFKIQEILDDKDYSTERALDNIHINLSVLSGIDGYYDILQETKETISSLQNKLANRDNYDSDKLLLEAAQLVDHVMKVSE